MIAADRLRVLASSRLRGVINATGVLLHTNLGRAPTAGADVPRASNLEFDLETGTRGKRSTYLNKLIASTVGAEAALVVNNNAGALFLALAALAGRDGRVAVSRGELIEIGGSFRLPDLMTASGVHLVEVGTTNRTRASDFTSVPGTVEAVLKVHPSNYRVEGFTEEVPFSEMSAVAEPLGCSVHRRRRQRPARCQRPLDRRRSTSLASRRAGRPADARTGRRRGAVLRATNSSAVHKPASPSAAWRPSSGWRRTPSPARCASTARRSRC